MFETFRIIAQHPSTGRIVEFEINALSLEDARQQALQAGLIAPVVHRASAGTPPARPPRWPEPTDPRPPTQPGPDDKGRGPGAA